MTAKRALPALVFLSLASLFLSAAVRPAKSVNMKVD
jgi:hypothetical protein